MTTDPTVGVLRHFNRSFTQRIGVLDASFLGSGRALGPSRLLFEIGPGGAAVLDLRDRLDLDSGYVSRLLRELEDEGLVAVERDPDDGRRRIARLTQRGREAWDDLDRRSDDLAEALLSPLSERQREELADALGRADRLLRAATVHLDVVDPTSDDAVASVSAYFAELDDRFPTGFDAGDAITDDAPRMRAPHGVFLVAHADGEPVACGGVQKIDGPIAEIKRMWVHPDWRGLGLGRRMLVALEEQARSLGYLTVYLDTNSVLVEAIAMYSAAGYRERARYNDNPYARHWFEKDL